MRKFFFLVAQRDQFSNSKELVDAFLSGQIKARGPWPLDPKDGRAGPDADIYEIQIPTTATVYVESRSAGCRIPRANLDTAEVAEMIGLALAAKEGCEISDTWNVTALVEE